MNPEQKIYRDLNSLSEAAMHRARQAALDMEIATLGVSHEIRERVLSLHRGERDYVPPVANSAAYHEAKAAYQETFSGALEVHQLLAQVGQALSSQRYEQAEKLTESATRLAKERLDIKAEDLERFSPENRLPRWARLLPLWFQKRILESQQAESNARFKLETDICDRVREIQTLATSDLDQACLDAAAFRKDLRRSLPALDPMMLTVARFADDLANIRTLRDHGPR